MFNKVHIEETKPHIYKRNPLSAYIYLHDWDVDDPNKFPTMFESTVDLFVGVRLLSYERERERNRATNFLMDVCLGWQRSRLCNQLSRACEKVSSRMEKEQ